MWLKNEKLFKDGFKSSRITQQTQVYALKYGLVDENYKSSLVKFIEAEGKRVNNLFLLASNSMFSEGKGQWALNYIRKTGGSK